MLARVAAQIGQTERDGGLVSAAVRDYLAAVGTVITPEAAAIPPWGAALIAWAAIKDGIVPPVGAADPLAWIDWGGPMAAPQPGAVLVLTGGAGRRSLLIGMAARVQARKVYCVGAFDAVVQTRAVPLEQVIAARRPVSGTGPMAMPQIAPEPSRIVIEQVPAIISAPPVPAVVAPAPVADARPFTQEAAQALLDMVQDKFRSLDERIDQVAAASLAEVRLIPEDAHD